MAEFKVIADDEGLCHILQKLYKERGVDVRDYRYKCLRRRINTRLRARGVFTYKDYAAVLNRDPSEYDELLNVVTINVTEFFRNPETWKVIEEKILPEIIERKTKRNQRIIRMWSAGTSYGEETYSLSMLMHEILGARLNDYIIKIYGTDIDKECIEKAELGEYMPESMKEISPKRLKKYFYFTGNSYIISDPVRLITRFRHHDMVLNKPIMHVDLVICRNVLIYFQRKLQDEIFQKFYQALNTDGYLVLGKVESLWGEQQRLFESVDTAERIYQKVTRNQ